MTCLSSERKKPKDDITPDALPKDRKNVPRPHSLAPVSGSPGTAGGLGLPEPSPLGSGTLPMGLAGHVRNLFLFLDISAHAV